VYAIFRSCQALKTKKKFSTGVLERYGIAVGSLLESVEKDLFPGYNAPGFCPKRALFANKSTALRTSTG
jgi:hypothetical protein